LLVIALSALAGVSLAGSASGMAKVFPGDSQLDIHEK